ncbi:hypothetical protein [Roseimicrobium gellanilyticum]|nr:hypothetical protein [Roseimicrobium gellanilyticum]
MNHIEERSDAGHRGGVWERPVPRYFIGFLVTFVTWFLGALLWGMAFDGSGGEPFSRTFFGSMPILPGHLLFIFMGTLYWAAQRGWKKILLGTGLMLLLSAGLWGLGWFVFG